MIATLCRNTAFFYLEYREKTLNFVVSVYALNIVLSPQSPRLISLITKPADRNIKVYLPGLPQAPNYRSIRFPLRTNKHVVL